MKILSFNSIGNTECLYQIDAEGDVLQITLRDKFTNTIVATLEFNSKEFAEFMKELEDFN